MKELYKRFKQWLCGLAGHKYYPYVGEKHHKICLYCGKERRDWGYIEPKKDRRKRDYKGGNVIKK